jgi:membrane dipeptidase
MATKTYFSEAEAALTRRIGVLTAHEDFPLCVAKRRFDGDYNSLATYWIPQLRSGGINVVVGAIATPAVYVPDGALRHAVWVLDALRTELAENQKDIELALSAADISRINAAGKIAVILSMEGAEPLGNDLSVLRLLHRLGLRMLCFTWMRRTMFGDGSWENESRGGLTRLGRQAVREMNRLGIVVDVSHASDQTTWDILETASGPVIASHSNARAILDHPRNLTDEIIRAISARGGVIGAMAGLVETDTKTIARWVDHIEHVVRIGGIDHVGIGTVYFLYKREIGAWPDIMEWVPGPHRPYVPFEGMAHPADLPGLTAELLSTWVQREGPAQDLSR